MSDIVIRAENLGKKYIIGHQSEKGRGRYTALRDVLAQNAQSYWQKTKDLLQGKAIIEGDAMEEVWALRDVNFEIGQGEAVGIIGRNGAGKSTLLKILSRITEPSTGRVTLCGRVASLLEVGTGFHPELSGRENIYLNGAILGMMQKEITRKFDEIVDFSGVEQYLDTPVKRYSSGMYVRLAFAVAAHLEPEILVVDEVLAVGDAEFQKKCLGKMGDVASQGRTVLFVSHNIAAILALCNKAMLLNNGRLQTTGEPQSVASEYLAGGTDTGREAVVAYSDGSITNELRVCTVRALNPSHDVAADISVTGGVNVEIGYQVMTPLRGANIGIHLLNASGVCVLSTTDIDYEPSLNAQTRMPGNYQTYCHIPPQYLRPGRYSISVSASISGVRTLVDIPQILIFNVIDTGSVDSLSGQGRQGIVAPTLEWHSQKVEPLEGDHAQ